MNLLFVGDVVGTAGIDILERYIYKLKCDHSIDFTVVNGENSAVGNGITKQSYDRLMRLGADVVTGGNHSFQQRGCEELYEQNATLLRPANYPDGVIGTGVYIADLFPVRIAVINLMGTVGLEALENPFFTADRLIDEAGTPNIIIDFHAEATSEKKALGHYLARRVTAVLGTHTHVQTADEMILGGGTAYITDAGMTGPEISCLGADIEPVLNTYRFHMPARFSPSANPCFLCGVVVEFDEKSGKSHKIQRIIIR